MAVLAIRDGLPGALGFRPSAGAGERAGSTIPEFERELISERTIAGLASARARGRKGGRPYKMTPAKIRLVMASMGQPDTNVGALCKELGITRQTLYRHVSPTGQVRPDGAKVLEKR